MTLFSIIIPAFNRANFIQATLKSVFAQESNDYEIIVVDDGSTDGTLDVLARYGEDIKVFQQENKGPGEARNLGISNAQGQYIVFLDSDDLWFPWTLSTFEQVIKNYNYPSFITGSSFYFKDDSELSGIQPQPLEFQCFSDYYTAATQYLPFLTSAVAVKRTVLQKTHGFTSQRINAEDNDLWMKLGTAEEFVYIHSPKLLGYRQHEYSAIASNTKTYEGTCYLIQQEKQGQYPGENNRQGERLEILTRHIRPVSIACLRQVELQQAWFLYKETILWHILLLRIRYLIVFPLLFLFTMLRQNFLKKPHNC
ncbi:MAG: glycosyltransferase family 2 protein [Nodularia sp. (in: Bacteria)]|nr:MAG: glycosyltransferase family 2 protein [Nodularia sp. (in: cyanobacteria)]